MKRLWKFLKWAGLFLFVFFNVLAYNHAHKFTNFKKQEAKDTLYHTKGGIAETLGYAFFGIDHPRAENDKIPSIHYQQIKLKTDGLIDCWILNPPVDTNTKGTIICYHGYAGEKTDVLDRAEEFVKMGYRTMLVDFRGSGASEGNNTTVGYKEAEEVRVSYQYMADCLGEKNIYLYGNSMGAVAIMKAIQNEPIVARGLILECPFGTMYETTVARFRMMKMPPVPFAAMLVFYGGAQNGFWAFNHNPTDYAKAIKVPTLLMYGEIDNRVSRAETDAIFQNLAGPKTLKTFPNVGHENFLEKAPEAWKKSVGEFLGE